MSEARGVPMPAPVEAHTGSRVGELGRRVLSIAVLLPFFVWVLVAAPSWIFTVVVVVCVVCCLPLSNPARTTRTPIVTAARNAAGAAKRVKRLCLTAQPGTVTARNSSARRAASAAAASCQPAPPSA